MPNRRDFLLLSAAAGLALAARPAFATGADLAFNDLYEREAELSALARSLTGQPVVMSGFMAPPLKAQSSFFVLTETPMAVCPFCETEAQ